jgi:WD40 repeat protein/transcriptional regulator with XRE-family HTH domain
VNSNISFGNFVRQRRRELDLTQEELARRVGCAAITIRKIEADDARASVQIAERLAMALSILLNERAEFVRQARAARPEAPAVAETPAPAFDEIGRADLTGRAIRGYALAEKIGAGGMGAVYRAVQPLVEREVAIKIILPALANHSDFIRRFEAEAQLVARLEHPHIVPLYDYWREPGVAYLVMRLLRGGSVQGLLESGPLSIETVTHLLEQICAALHSAHRIGIIHRDLKPGNVLLDEDNNAYLADFGIAKNLGNPDLENATEIDALVGSPQYMSPEQIRSLNIRPQTDIYCLGVMLYEMLSGVLPFTGPTPFDLLQQHVNAPLPSLAAHRSGLPAALDMVISRAAAKNPDERYPDVLALLNDFHRALGGDGAQTHPIFIPAAEEANVALINPYKGLRAFSEADAEDFFGREILIQQLLARLGEGGELTRFLAVLGPSGSGKSSVAKAGLMPALRRGGLPDSENWFLVDFIPGPHPFEELEAALLRVAANPPASLLSQLKENERGLLRAVNRILPADPSIELVLVIDQFEEVFTLTADETERALLLNNLVAAALDERSRVRIIITLRADFIDRPLRYVDFGELIQRRSELVLPLTPDEVERAILGPAQRAGLRLESGLVAAMTRDVGDQPGGLPLLQYALTELFEKCITGADGHSNLLTKAAYTEIGGVLGALGRRAEEVYTALDETRQSAARQLFMRLVTLGEGVEDTRRRALRAEIESLVADDGQSSSSALRPSSIVDAFAKHRLLSLDRDPLTRSATVEVAHEALIREWPRLREWLNESRGSIRLQRQLASAATEWRNAKDDASFLLAGARLAQFENLAESSALALTQQEHEYLQASIAERARQQAQEQARQGRENARLRLRNRVITTVGVIALVLALLAGLFGLQSNQNASVAQAANTQVVDERNSALNAQATAQTEAVVRATAEANAQGNAAKSQILALVSGSQAALAGGNTDQAIALALQAVTLDPLSTKAQVALGEAAYAPGTIRRLVGPGGGINSVELSPDGRTFLATVVKQEKVFLGDLQTGEIIRQFEGHHGAVVNAVFSPDGDTALSASKDGTLILWNVGTGALIRHFEGHTGEVLSVAFSPNGRTALSGGADKTLILWDVQTGQIVRRFGADGTGHTAAVARVIVSQDDRTVLSLSSENMMILWDLETGQAIHRFTEEIGPSVALSPDGRTVLANAGDGSTLILWDLETGQKIRRFYGLRGAIRNIEFSPDGRRALTAGQDGILILWDIATGQLINRFRGHEGEVMSIALSRDGLTVLSGSLDGTLRLWDLEGGQVMRRFAGQKAWVFGIAYSPDGRTALTGSVDGTTILWDLQTGAEIRRYTGTDRVGGVAYSPDGQTALIADGWLGQKPRYIVLWDVNTGQEIRRFVGHPAGLNSVAFSPNGRMAVSSGVKGVVILWDVETGQEIRRFQGPDVPYGAVTAVFSPDGRTILSGFGNGEIILWDVASGKEIRKFAGHTSIVSNVVFSPDGQRAFSGSWDNTAIYWDVTTGSILHHFREHNAAVNQVRITPDGRFGLAGSSDNTTLLWDLNTGEVIRRYIGANAGIWSSAFSADGRSAIVSFFDGNVALWRIDATLDELLNWIHANRYIPELTCEQKALYQLEPLCPEATAR